MKRSPVSSLVLTTVCVSSLGSSPSNFRSLLRFWISLILLCLLLYFWILLPGYCRFRSLLRFGPTTSILFPPNFSVVMLFSVTCSFCFCLFYTKSLGQTLRAESSSNLCRRVLRMIPPSWSLIKWLYRKPDWNFFY